MDIDSFVFSVNTKDSNKNLKNLADIVDFSNLNENYELLSIKNKTLTGKIKIKALEKF